MARKRKAVETKTKVQPKQVEQKDDEDNDEEDEEDEENEQQQLHDDESDYSDLEEEGTEKTDAVTEQEDVIPLSSDQVTKEHKPLVKATANKIKKVMKAGKPQEGETRGVVYLGHIPYGFFEEQMTMFFTQFGEVTRLKLSRNSRGKSKHYAFIEFRSDEVARIVADAMNNYMMYDRTLVAKFVPQDEVHEDTFNNTEKRFHKVPFKKMNRQMHNRQRSAKEQKTRVKSLVKKENKRRKKLKDLGIDYDFPGYKAKVPAVPKRKKFD